MYYAQTDSPMTTEQNENRKQAKFANLESFFSKIRKHFLILIEGNENETGWKI